MKKIDIKLNKTLTRIAGNEYGQKVYNEQVKPEVDSNGLKEKYLIVFPNTVTAVANSFVQGFIKNIPPYIIPEVFYNYFSIEGSDEFKEEFREGLYY